jgi:hypothetical protein
VAAHQLHAVLRVRWRAAGATRWLVSERSVVGGPALCYQAREVRRGEVSTPASTRHCSRKSARRRWSDGLIVRPALRVATHFPSWSAASSRHPLLGTQARISSCSRLWPPPSASSASLIIERSRESSSVTCGFAPRTSGVSRLSATSTTGSEIMESSTVAAPSASRTTATSWFGGHSGALAQANALAIGSPDSSARSDDSQGAHRRRATEAPALGISPGAGAPSSARGQETQTHGRSF